MIVDGQENCGQQFKEVNWVFYIGGSSRGKQRRMDNVLGQIPNT